jgi:hypothetical protein
MRNTARFFVLALAAVMMMALAVAPASAQQNGLVNVDVSDVLVQAPIGIAANLCDINANVLAEQLRAGGAECDAQATSDAVHETGGNGEAPHQEGLVNVAVYDVTIQVPVAVAANICDANVNALARQLRGGGAECDAAAASDAQG